MTDTFTMDNVSWIFDDGDFEYFIEQLAMNSEVTLDLETTGLNEYADGTDSKWPVSARIVLAQFTLPNGSTYLLPLSHPESPWLGQWRKKIRQVCITLADNEIGIIGHNVKFDLRWLWAQTGIDVSHLLLWDTQISSHLLDETESTKLKRVAPRLFGIESWDDAVDFTKLIDGKAPAEVANLFELGLYGAKDTYWTMKLSQAHRYEMDVNQETFTPDEVESVKLGILAKWCAMPMVKTLTAIEQRGIRMDEDWVASTIHDLEILRDNLWDFLVNMYPREENDKPSFAPTSLWFRAWADQAVEANDLQVAALTPTGKPQWSKSVLVRQVRTGSKVAEGLLEYRMAMKRLEYLRAWQAVVTPKHTIHTTYRAGGVVTGRLSSNSPNMQQITAALKAAFVPREGYFLVDLDYSQIELRAAAFIAKCQPMIEAFQRGDDLHSLLASRITGKDPKDVTSEERQAGKSANFGLLYGMGAYGFQQYAEDVYGVSFTVSEAEDIHWAFFDVWKGMKEWHIKQAVDAHRTGQVSSPIGRIRRLPDIHSGNEKLSSMAERQAINAPVQGFASDLMQIAAASIEGNIPGYAVVEHARIVATVHDSIVVEIPISNWQEVTQECLDRMTGVTEILAKMGCNFDVPLAAEPKVGTRWGMDDISVVV